MKVINRTRLLSAAALAVCSAGLSAQAPATTAGRTQVAADVTTMNREIALEWMRDAGPIAGGAVSGAHLGRNVAAAGDVNGDGFQDMLVAAYDTDASAEPGTVYLVFGHRDMDANFQLAATSGSTSGGSRSTLFGQASTHPVIDFVTLQGSGTGAQTGAGLAAAGDIDGDGFDDFLIGAPLADGDAGADTGAVWLIYGSDDLDETIDLGTLQEGQGTLFEGRFADDRLGASVAGLGDVNGDGLLDLAMGAHWASTDGGDGQATFPTHSGSVYVVFGKGHQLGEVFDLVEVRSQGMVLHGAGAGDTFGRSLAAAGDVDDDGYADLLIGARNADPNGIDNAGAAYLVYGDHSLGGVIDLGVKHSGVTCFEGEQARAYLGTSVAAGGDVNGDGHADLLIGAPGHDASPYSNSNEGRVYLVLGSSSTPGSVGVSELGDVVQTERETGSVPAGAGPGRVQGLTGTSMARNIGGMVMTGELPGAQIGTSLAIGGDTNGDRLSEMLIGGQGAARTYLVHGAPVLPTELNLADLGALGVVLTDADGNAQSAALVGDMDGDRYSEIVIGNPATQPDRIPGAGQAQIVKGGAHFFQAQGELALGTSFDMVIHGTPNEHWLLMVSASKRNVPQITGKGTWWLGDVYFEVLPGWHDDNGESVHQVNVPNDPMFEGVTVYWQVLEAPQGRQQDLSQPLTTSIH